MQKTIDDGLELSKADAIYKVFKNNSATTLTGGTIVCLDTTDSSGQSVTLPSAEADPLVWGVVVTKRPKEEIADQDDCLVCVNGVCKVAASGRDDILVGSLLSAYDTNGVAQVHSNNLSCVFGTALEGYTTNDSSGWINVYVGKRG